MDNKTNKMLIDATHPEETRVVVLRNGRVEEFDYESAARKLLRGNIYLAKVTRVEPSLQAAFVEYGGNRHGFLAFNEIHPDYYQIPVSDRQALIEEEAAAEAEADAEADARAERKYQGGGGEGRRRDGNREGGREGGRDSGRRGGRNGNRQQQAQGDRGPAGSGDQPSFGANPSSADAVPATDQHAAHAAGDKPEYGPGEVAHERDDHNHEDAAHEVVADAGGAHAEGQGSIAEATGHYDDRVSETYVPSEESHADRRAPAADDQHHHADDDHTGHEHTGHEHTGHEHTGSDHNNASEPDAGHREREVDVTARGDARIADHIEEVPEVVEAPETIGAEADTGTEDDIGEDVQDRPRRQRRRQYKIQEVIKRRQVILVQVVKEERGNKGAALTTYLSLAGRYTVLMPNTGRGGGISRKITNPADRKRLKAIAQELDVPEGMGLIIRTAGAARTNQEIKRDYEYLLRLWESVRDMTLQSTAPSLVYEEGNLIKRSIRDLYSKEIDEVVVAGDQAYHDAHDFMRMLMPSHAKNVIRYNHPEALFTRYPIERQLNAMFSPYVTLKSGGYLVINQTEALVSIDVNSGKSTREYSIEETALATNLEASDEIARQLKLRDLAGLIVIDFIDMEEKRNNRKVEHRLTDALRFDRARIQVGRISHFGLMEMSRQRMRTGVLEGSTSQCPHCQGTGMIRSTESVALAVLRGLEDHLVKDPRSSVNVMTTATVALYILNNKRSFITDIERRYGIAVAVQASDRMQGANFAIERSAAPVVAPRQADRAAVSMDWGFEGEEPHEAEGHDRHDTGAHEGTVESVEDDSDIGDGGDEGEGRSDAAETGRTGRRRRRRRGRDRGERQPNAANGGEQPAHRDAESMTTLDAGHEAVEGNFANRQPDTYADAGTADLAEAGEDGATANAAGVAGDDGERSARRGRRRGRRGGRRGREQRDDAGRDGAQAAQPTDGDESGPEDDANGAEMAEADAHPSHAPASMEPADAEGHHEPHAAEPAIQPVISEAGRMQPTVDIATVDTVSNRAPEAPISAIAKEPIPAAETHPPEAQSVPQSQLPEAPDDPSRPRRRGWWQRRGLGE